MEISFDKMIQVFAREDFEKWFGPKGRLCEYLGDPESGITKADLIKDLERFFK